MLSHPFWNTPSCLKHSSLHHGSSKNLQVEVKGSILLVDIALRSFSLCARCFRFAGCVGFWLNSPCFLGCEGLCWDELLEMTMTFNHLETYATSPPHSWTFVLRCCWVCHHPLVDLSLISYTSFSVLSPPAHLLIVIISSPFFLFFLLGGWEWSNQWPTPHFLSQNGPKWCESLSDSKTSSFHSSVLLWRQWHSTIWKHMPPAHPTAEHLFCDAAGCATTLWWICLLYPIHPSQRCLLQHISWLSLSHRLSSSLPCAMFKHFWHVTSFSSVKVYALEL